MAGHCARIAEAEIDVAVTIDIVEMSALGFPHKRWKGSGPFHHPVHGHAGQQGLAGTFEKRFRLRALIDKLLPLFRHERFQAITINGHVCLWIRGVQESESLAEGRGR